MGNGSSRPLQCHPFWARSQPLRHTPACSWQRDIPEATLQEEAPFGAVSGAAHFVILCRQQAQALLAPGRGVAGRLPLLREPLGPMELHQPLPRTGRAAGSVDVKIDTRPVRAGLELLARVSVSGRLGWLARRPRGLPPSHLLGPHLQDGHRLGHQGLLSWTPW